MFVQDSRPPVAADAVDTPNLTPAERSALIDCINSVRAGEVEFYVTVTNRKVTKSRKRLPNRDYVPDPALVPYAHKGWLVAAPINQQGKVYLHIYDEARAASQGDDYGHTRVTMEGILSFKVETDPRTGEPITRPGPLGDPDDAIYGGDPVPEPVAAAAPAYPEPMVDPLLMAANAMFASAQALSQQAAAMTQMGQALLARSRQEAEARLR
jgi:hypothetical protein